MTTNIWLRLRRLLALLVVIATFASPVTFCYDGQNQTAVAYDGNGTSSLGYDAVPVLATTEKNIGTIGDRRSIAAGSVNSIDSA